MEETNSFKDNPPIPWTNQDTPSMCNTPAGNDFSVSISTCSSHTSAATQSTRHDLDTDFSFEAVFYGKRQSPDDDEVNVPSKRQRTSQSSESGFVSDGTGEGSVRQDVNLLSPVLSLFSPHTEESNSPTCDNPTLDQQAVAVSLPEIPRPSDASFCITPDDSIESDLPLDLSTKKNKNGVCPTVQKSDVSPQENLQSEPKILGPPPPLESIGNMRTLFVIEPASPDLQSSQSKCVMALPVHAVSLGNLQNNADIPVSLSAESVVLEGLQAADSSLRDFITSWSWIEASPADATTETSISLAVSQPAESLDSAVQVEATQQSLSSQTAESEAYSECQPEHVEQVQTPDLLMGVVSTEQTEHKTYTTLVSMPLLGDEPELPPLSESADGTEAQDPVPVVEAPPREESPPPQLQTQEIEKEKEESHEPDLEGELATSKDMASILLKPTLPQNSTLQYSRFYLSTDNNLEEFFSRPGTAAQAGSPLTAITLHAKSTNKFRKERAALETSDPSSPSAMRLLRSGTQIACDPSQITEQPSCSQEFQKSKRRLSLASHASSESEDTAWNVDSPSLRAREKKRSQPARMAESTPELLQNGGSTDEERAVAREREKMLQLDCWLELRRVLYSPYLPVVKMPRSKSLRPVVLLERDPYLDWLASASVSEAVEPPSPQVPSTLDYSVQSPDQLK